MGNVELLHRVRQRMTEARPCVFRGWALVRRRLGIASVVTINLPLPHFHEGAGS
jgi:hypothetical protein